MSTQAARRWPLWAGATVTGLALLLSTGSLFRRGANGVDRVVVVEDKLIAPSPSPVVTAPSPPPAPVAVSPPFAADEVERLIAAGATARATELIEAAEKDPATRALAYTLHARLDVQRGRFAQAEDYATRSLALRPSVDALLARGDARLRAKNLKGAEEDFRAVLARAPRNAEARDALELIERSE